LDSGRGKKQRQEFAQARNVCSAANMLKVSRKTAAKAQQQHQQPTKKLFSLIRIFPLAVA